MKNVGLILLSLFSFSISALGTDTASASILKPEIATYSYNTVPHDPFASALFSGIVMGSGQIYNKEYGRGLLCGSIYYTNLLIVWGLIKHFEALNTDTVYIKGISKGEEKIFQFFTPKPDSELRGLPDKEKALLVASIATVGITWVWGIVDAYLGAERYNRKISLTSSENKFSCQLGYAMDRGMLLNVGLKF